MIQNREIRIAVAALVLAAFAGVAGAQRVDAVTAVEVEHAAAAGEDEIRTRGRDRGPRQPLVGRPFSERHQQTPKP